MTTAQRDKVEQEYGTLHDRVERARGGDRRERERLLEEYRPFMAGTVTRMRSGDPRFRGVDARDTEEYSVAMMAFNEAIDTFQRHRNVPFPSYAGQVIRHRLLDWFRKQARHRATTPFSDLDDRAGDPAEEQVGSTGSEWAQETESTQDVAAFLKTLSVYGLDLDRVRTRFPKHKASRVRAIRLARMIAEQPDLEQTVLRDRHLPTAALARRSRVPVKTVEKHRDSILFLYFLLRSDLDVIRGYIRDYEEATS